MVPDDSEFNRSRFSRGVMVPIDEAGQQVRSATPEDAILEKLEYFREGGSDKHVRDIKGVRFIQGDAIDFDYLSKWAERLGVVEQLKQIQNEL